MTTLLPARPPSPGPHGLALPGSLVLLGLLGVAAAIAQRAAAWPWRAAQLQAEQLQLREDAMTAQAAALQWLRRDGWREPLRDCASMRSDSQHPVLCADPAADARRPPWSQTWSQGIDGCVHACGFRVQQLPAPAGGARTMRILAYARGRSVQVLQHDVLAIPAGPSSAPAPATQGEPATGPCWRLGDGRVLR